RGAVALTGNLRLTIGQQLDIASEHDRYRLVDAAVALWQGGLGFFGDFSNSLTPRLTSWCLWQGFAVQHVIPGDFCYNSHCFDSSREGLNWGVCRSAWRRWARALAMSAYLLRYFSRLRFLPARVRSQHSCGVFGIYRASSGRCVSFHQPLRDSTVEEHFNMDIIISLFR